MALRVTQRGRGAAHRLPGPRLGVGQGHLAGQRHRHLHRQQAGGHYLRPDPGQVLFSSRARLLTGRRGQDVLACLAVPDGRPGAAERGAPAGCRETLFAGDLGADAATALADSVTEGRSLP